MKKVDYLILGGGVAGLGASIALENRGKDCLLLEKDNVPGGLNRSETVCGCGFDFGPKILILDDSENSKEILGYLEGNYEKYPMEESVYLRDYGLVGFPLQRYLVDLPEEIRDKVIKGAKQALDDPKEVRSFKDWLINCFGDYFANWIMIPYEEKKWQIPLEKMDFEWATKRPINIDLEEMIKGSNVHLPPNRWYYYPKYGRIDSLVFAMAREAGLIEFGKEVVSVDLNNKIVKTKDGDSYKYGVLVSTLALDSFVDTCQKNYFTEEMKADRNNLKRLGIVVFNVVFEGNYPLKGSAIYFPEKEFVFRRVSVLQNLCPALRRDKKTPISIEVSLKGGESFEALFLQSLKELRTIPQFRQLGKVLGYKYRRIDFGYPLQVNDLLASKEGIRRALETFNVYLCGRGGNFEYCNSDVAYKQGKELGNRI